MNPEELAHFLGRHAPFDMLAPEDLDVVARASRLDAYEPDELVLDAFAAPSAQVVVVVSGRVAVWDDDAPGQPADEVLGVGRFFGLSSMLTDRPIGPRAFAVEAVTVARIPEPALEPILFSPRGARFLADWRSEATAVQDTAPTYRTVDELVRGEPLVVAPTTSAADVARAMTERDVPCAVVALGEGRFGLVTDSLLRRRVLVDGLPASAPVREVMDPDPPLVQVGHSSAEALILLYDRDAEYLLVVNDGGGLRGVVASRDFVVAPTTAGISLHEQLRRATTTDELVELGSRVPETLQDLLRRGLTSEKVIAVYSSTLDALVRRAIELVFLGHPELSLDAFTWIALGSNGRREAVLSSDVDSAVAFDDAVPPEAAAAYQVAFAEVDHVVAQAGVSHDAHGATAAYPLFARTNAEWRAAARKWLAAPEANNGAMMTSLLVDGRPIHGDPGLPAVTAAFADLRRHPATMRLLLQESLAHRARMRSARDLFTRRVDRFDVKTHAMLPIVNLARWSALAVGSSALPTVDRLRAAAGSAMLPADRAETLIEVFWVLQRLRVRYQLMQRAAGEPPSDLLQLDQLSPIDRSLISEAVREIAAIQRRMTNMAHYLPTEGWTAPTPS